MEDWDSILVTTQQQSPPLPSTRIAAIMEAAAPPPYYITNKRGKKVHNPEHIEYMNTKYSSDNTNNNGVDTSTNTPHKYIKDPDTGEVIENPAYRRAMGLEEQPSKAHHQKSTLLDSVRQGTGSSAAKTNKDTTNSSAGGGYIVDLSNDFQKQSDHLQNPGSKLLELDFKKFKEVRRCTVIENGTSVSYLSSIFYYYYYSGPSNS